MKNFYNKGITVIELLIVFAVIGILVTITLPQFSKIRENQVLKTAVNDILSSLDKARTNTLASVNSDSYGVHFQSDQIIIFKGTSFTSGAAGNEVVNIVTPASITNVTLGGVSGVSGDIYFNRLSGSPSTIDNNTITVSTTNYSRIITISATGVAN